MSITVFKRLLLITAILAALSACSTESHNASTSGPQIWQVTLDPALSWMRPVLNTCIQPIEDTTLDISETELPASTPIVLSWGEVSWQKSSSIHQLGKDHFVLGVNLKNPLNQISSRAVRSIFTGTTTEWSKVDQTASDLSEVQVWLYPSSAQLQNRFMQMLNVSSQRPVSSHLAPDPAALIQAVSADPAAIGWLPHNALSTGIKGVEIDGAPSDSTTLPIPAYLQTKPTSEQSAWLFCLQTQLSKLP
jgi:hypothetical protein